MKFSEIFKFELKFQLGRPSIWIFILFVISLCTLATISLIENVQEGDYYLNSPVIVSLVTAVSSMFGLLLTAAMCGNAAVRDRQTKMDSLLNCTSLGKFNYLGGRFLAILYINLMILVVLLLLLFAASLLAPFKEIFGPISILSYGIALLYFALPNTLITTSFLFGFSLLTRKSMAAFLAAALLFLVAFFSMDILAGELGKWELAKNLDLSGLTFLKEFRAIQTPLELKSAFVQPSQDLVLNRLLWLIGSLTLLCWAYFKFSFELHTTKKKSSLKKDIRSSYNTKEAWSEGISVPNIIRPFDFNTAIKQVSYLSLSSFGNMWRGMVWLIYPAIAIITIIASEEILEGQLGVPLIPSTYMVLAFLKAMGTGLIMALLITYYVGNLVWKERDAGQHEINDASPAKNWVFFLSKFIGLVMLLLFMQLLVMITGLTVQFLMDSPSIDISLYLKVLFGLRFIDLVLFAVIAFLVHVLVNQKYVGHLIVFLVFFYMYFPALMKLDHNLLIYGSAPEWWYSEISGFGTSLEPWFWFKFYWGAWAIILAFIAGQFWVRGKENRFFQRLKQTKYSVPAKSLKLGLPLIIVVFLIGGFIFYNTNILNNYDTATERTERQVAYEKKYKQYEDILQPILSKVKLWVELFPEDQKAEIKGTYALVNPYSEAIDTVHISTTSDISPDKIIFSRKVSVVVEDNDLGHRIYKLNKPLLPGETLSLEFFVRMDQRGFGNYGIERSVAGNGTYFQFHLMPAIGYQQHRELNDKEQRQKYGLKPQEEMASLHDRKRIMDLSGNEKIDFEAVLGTSPEQTAITAGTLKKTWMENNRRYFYYATDVPITHNYEIFSAEYQVLEDQWQDVKIQIFYHPTHTQNLERMISSVKASLAYFSENFSPYPHKEIRLVEFPGSGVSLNGNPVTMSYTEGFSFFAPEKDLRNVDFPFAVIAHEVAHQWWGNELRPAFVEGAPVLTESLAWYSAWMVIERKFGKDYLEQIHQIMRQEYLTPRSPADLPLIRTTDRFNFYRKGPFALYSLKEYVGKEKVNLALRKLLNKSKNGPTPLPTTLDLYAELRQVTPDSLQSLLHDLFAENTFWDMQGVSASASRMQNGDWEVIFKTKINKTTVDIKGNVKQIPLNDYIELTLYAPATDQSQGELLYSQKHLISSEELEIKIRVSKKPALAVIDPNHLLIDRDVTNNSVQIKYIE